MAAVIHVPTGMPRPKTGPHANKCWKQGHGPLSSLAHCGFAKGHVGPHAWAHLDRKDPS